LCACRQYNVVDGRRKFVDNIGIGQFLFFIVLFKDGDLIVISGRNQFDKACDIDIKHNLLIRRRFHYFNIIITVSLSHVTTQVIVMIHIQYNKIAG
jgi:hypothetical protein